MPLANPQHPRLPLTRRQLATMIAVGAALWLAAALLLRTIGPLGAFEGTARVMLYVAVIPGTWPFVRLARRLAGLRADQVAIGTAVTVATATLLDGIALAWFPALYGSSAEQVAAAAAAILWGAGVALVLGMLANHTVVTVSAGVRTSAG